MKSALVIHPRDNVAVVTQPVFKGEEISCPVHGQSYTITAREDIPIYHKVALEEIGEDQLIIKYAQTIGKATRQIFRGEHVHCHNVISVPREM